MTDDEKLRALAEAARGDEPWEASRVLRVNVNDAEGRNVCTCWDVFKDDAAKRAAYIAAADPGAVVALLDRAQRAEQTATDNDASYCIMRDALERERVTYRENVRAANERAVAAERERDELQAALEVAREALGKAHAFLDGAAGWSGAAGNWPLQDALSATREALAALPPRSTT